MRANHTKIKNIARQEKGLLTDKGFFSSLHFRGYLNDISEIISRRYGMKAPVVHTIHDSSSEVVARTDNVMILVNTDNILVKDAPTRYDKFQIILGILLHELAHILYTDFDLSIREEKHIKTSKEFLSEPISMDSDMEASYEDLKEYLSTKKKVNAFCSLYFTIDNSIEDAAINEIVSGDYPGFAPHLEKSNQAHKEIFPSFEEQLKEEKFKIFTIINLLLSYAKFGEVNADKRLYGNERIQTVFSAIEYIDEAISCYDAGIRRRCVNSIVLILWDYIKEYLDTLPDEEEKAEEKTKEETKSPTPSAPKPELSKKPSANSSPNGNSVPKANSSTPNTPSPEKKNGGTKEEIEKALNKGKTAKVKSGSPSASVGAMNGLEDDISMENAEKKVKREVEAEFNHNNLQTNYDEIHNGISCHIERVEYDYNDKVAYNKIASVLIRISKNLQRVLKPKIKIRKLDSKNTGLSFGRRIDSHCLVRQDDKVFFKRNLPNENPEISVCLLIDESGSMEGRRIEASRNAAIVLYDFCQGLGLPVAVYGHTAGYNGYDVYINAYATFDNPTPNDRYRMMRMTDLSSNRDGYALKYCLNELSKQLTQIKLMIIISDGRPAAKCYHGTSACDDIRKVIKEYAKKGIVTFAAAIGSDKETIESIYKEGFLDISDLSLLPSTLTKLVKKYLKF